MQPGAGIAFAINGQEASIDKIGMADLVAFERQFGISASQMSPPALKDEDGNVVVDENGEVVPDASKVRMEWIAFLVWRSSRRQGLIGKDVEFDDDFLECIDDVELNGSDSEDPDVDPTKAVPLET